MWETFSLISDHIFDLNIFLCLACLVFEETSNLPTNVSWLGILVNCSVRLLFSLPCMSLWMYGIKVMIVSLLKHQLNMISICYKTSPLFCIGINFSSIKSSLLWDKVFDDLCILTLILLILEALSLRYARGDTHYMLYIYDLMRIKLLGPSAESESSDSPLMEASCYILFRI